MKIRINQDVTFNWKLTVEGESVDLSKLELSVEITTPSNKKAEITPTIQFDTLEFNYRPKQVGEYILSAYLNRFKDGETALDIKAFEGVKYSWNQDFSTDDTLEANYVELAGDFNFGPNVPSAPDVPSVDLSDYAKTTYVDTQINNEATARTQADSELQSKINTKQDKIIAGTGIDITDNTISCTLDTTIFTVVDALPMAPLSRNKNKIHLVLSSSSEEGNAYDEYLWVNNSWEKIGSFIPSVDLSDYATTSYVDTKASYIDTQINNEATARTQADAELQSKINSKQDTLTAGENIKIENNVISAINLSTSVDLSDYAKTTYVDTQINGESTARSQADSELQSKINTKQDTLTAGENIKIENNVISAIDLRPSVDLSDYAKKTYVDTQINGESTARTQADSELQSKINTKQDKIIAGAGIDITDNTISCTVDTTIFKVVDSLPVSPSRGDENKIHLVLSTNSEESNSYDEYLWVNTSWEKIGSFIPSVDLSMYAEKSYVDSQIASESTARTQADVELQSKINSKQDTLTAGENIKIENNVISSISVAKISLNTTWAELKVMRDNSQLVAGQQYRITDYTCTTTQAATKSAGHVFDIIVTADDESTLNEVARAVKHDGDEYFANSDLNAWKIWYCIDNDTDRFAWADSVNGKGVIYRMIDEFANDCPYDFKNIQFYRQWDEDKQLWSTISDGNTGVPCYTFSSNGDSSTVDFTDMSLSKSNNVYSNVIKEYINIGKQTLNNICFFGNNCYRNSFGSDCYFNSFGTGCDANTFGCRCNTNSFGYGCGFNTFDNKFEYNSLGTYCLSNSFGNDCSYNVLDDTCFGNSFGNNCVYNSIGESCSYNSFGNGCSYIKFASDSSATTKYAYYQNNHFGDGCEYIVFTGAENVANASEIHNYNFAQGLQGTANNYLIVEGKRNRVYETYISKGTDGTIKESVIAEKQDKLTAGENIKIENNVISAIDLMPSVDLSDYAKTTYVDTQISSETTTRTQADAELQTHINDEVNARTQADTELQTHINDEVNARTQADTELQSKINSKQDTLTAGDNIKIENNVISAIGGGTTGATELLVKITWAELKSLRDNSLLVAGQQYRITDYTCTTTKAATKSAGHVFDIIVTADSDSVLNEEARAIQHEGDTYFTNCDLNAWKIWYCLDNDTNRFAWARSVGGKGVIYRMIDEFGNDCPYDFKNIQFYRKWDSSKSLWSTISSNNTGVPCYTFSSEGSSSNTSFIDMSLRASNNVYSNVIKEYISSNKQTLNNNCFFGTLCNKNTFEADCRENTFGNKCSSNVFGGYCFLNSFGNECNYNSFGGEFNQNSFGSGCSYNSFGSGCYINSFGDNCYLNSFGAGCHNNSFGIGCKSNSFGSDCKSNSFSSGCNYNSFGGEFNQNSFWSDCSYNSFGSGCHHNSFGSYCYLNSFGEGCNGNSIGEYCSCNSFGNKCNNIKFASNKNATTKYTFYQNNHFGDYCEYIILNGVETASAESQVQNYNFAQGVQGTSNTYINVDGKRGRAYETKVAKNSSGTVKIYCEADLSK